MEIAGGIWGAPRMAPTHWLCRRFWGEPLNRTVGGNTALLILPSFPASWELEFLGLRPWGLCGPECSQGPWSEGIKLVRGKGRRLCLWAQEVRLGGKPYASPCLEATVVAACLYRGHSGSCPAWMGPSVVVSHQCCCSVCSSLGKASDPMIREELSPPAWVATVVAACQLPMPPAWAYKWQLPVAAATLPAPAWVNLADQSMSGPGGSIARRDVLKGRRPGPVDPECHVAG